MTLKHCVHVHLFSIMRVAIEEQIVSLGLGGVGWPRKNQKEMNECLQLLKLFTMYSKSSSVIPCLTGLKSLQRYDYFSVTV